MAKHYTFKPDRSWWQLPLRAAITCLAACFVLLPLLMPGLLPAIGHLSVLAQEPVADRHDYTGRSHSYPFAFAPGLATPGNGLVTGALPGNNIPSVLDPNKRNALSGSRLAAPKPPSQRVATPGPTKRQGKKQRRSYTPQPDSDGRDLESDRQIRIGGLRQAAPHVAPAPNTIRSGPTESHARPQRMEPQQRPVLRTSPQLAKRNLTPPEKTAAADPQQVSRPAPSAAPPEQTNDPGKTPHRSARVKPTSSEIADPIRVPVQPIVVPRARKRQQAAASPPAVEDVPSRPTASAAQPRKLHPSTTERKSKEPTVVALPERTPRRFRRNRKPVVPPRTTGAPNPYASKRAARRPSSARNTRSTTQATRAAAERNRRQAQQRREAQQRRRARIRSENRSRRRSPPVKPEPKDWVDKLFGQL